MCKCKYIQSINYITASHFCIPIFVCLYIFVIKKIITLKHNFTSHLDVLSIIVFKDDRLNLNH